MPRPSTTFCLHLNMHSSLSVLITSNQINIRHISSKWNSKRPSLIQFGNNEVFTRPPSLLIARAS